MLLGRGQNILAEMGLPYQHREDRSHEGSPPSPQPLSGSGNHFPPGLSPRGDSLPLLAALGRITTFDPAHTCLSSAFMESKALHLPRAPRDVPGVLPGLAGPPGEVRS